MKDLPLHEQLVSALSSKLCHDMATPIGSMGFAIELSEELQKNTDLVHAYDSLKGKLQVMREIFRSSESAPNLNESLRLLSDFASKNNVAIEGKLSDAQGPLARLLLGITWLAFEGIHSGGKIDMSLDSIGSVKWDVVGNKGVFLKEEAVAILCENSGEDAITNSTIIPLWLKQTMNTLGKSLTIQCNKAENSCVFTLA